MDLQITGERKGVGKFQLENFCDFDRCKISVIMI